MYDTLKSIDHALSDYYIWIFVTIAYLCCLWTIVETILICWKDKMTIDYILDWYDRRKHEKRRR